MRRVSIESLLRETRRDETRAVVNLRLRRFLPEKDGRWREEAEILTGEETIAPGAPIYEGFAKACLNALENLWSEESTLSVEGCWPHTTLSGDRVLITQIRLEPKTRFYGIHAVDFDTEQAAVEAVLSALGGFLDDRYVEGPEMIP